MPKTVFVTATFYEDTEDVRFQCALKTVKESKRCGYSIVVVDGSPIPEVVEAFRQEGAVVFSQIVRGMGPSRWEAVKHALNAEADIIVWLEPEKYPIVSLLEPCIEMVASGGYDLVIPRRLNLDNYPAYQHWSELRANHELSTITGKPELDLMIGPRVMSRHIAKKFFLAYDEKFAQESGYGNKWESLFIPVLWILAGRKDKIGFKTVNYIHPMEQKLAEESENTEAWNKKRDDQRETLIREMTEEAAKIGWRSLLMVQ